MKYLLVILISLMLNNFTRAQYASNSELREKVKEINSSIENYSLNNVRFSFLSSGNFRIIDNSGTVRSEAHKVTFTYKDEMTGIWVLCKENTECFEKGGESYNFLLVDPTSKKPLVDLMKETAARLNGLIGGFEEEQTELTDDELTYSAYSDMFGSSNEKAIEEDNGASIDASLAFIKAITNEMLLERSKSDLYESIRAIISEYFKQEDISDKTNGKLYGIIDFKDENYSYAAFFGLKKSDDEVLFQIKGDIKNSKIYPYLHSISANEESWAASNSYGIHTKVNRQKKLKTIELDERFELSKEINPDIKDSNKPNTTDIVAYKTVLSLEARNCLSGCGGSSNTRSYNFSGRTYEYEGGLSGDIPDGEGLLKFEENSTPMIFIGEWKSGVLQNNDKLLLVKSGYLVRNIDKLILYRKSNRFLFSGRQIIVELYEDFNKPPLNQIIGGWINGNPLGKHSIYSGSEMSILTGEMLFDDNYGYLISGKNLFGVPTANDYFGQELESVISEKFLITGGGSNPYQKDAVLEIKTEITKNVGSGGALFSDNYTKVEKVKGTSTQRRTFGITKHEGNNVFGTKSFGDGSVYFSNKGNSSIDIHIFAVTKSNQGIDLGQFTIDSNSYVYTDDITRVPYYYTIKQYGLRVYESDTSIPATSVKLEVGLLAPFK